jgi:NADPH:quinone reductase-like Zn-dependent oxidoreductase
MKAIVVTDQAAGTSGMKLVDWPEPHAAINDVVVEVHAAGFTWDELTWPPKPGPIAASVTGHRRSPPELAGVVTALGYGTAGLSVGQRVFGLADWYTRRATGRQMVPDFGAQEFVDLDNDPLEDVGGVDLVFDVLGGDIAKCSARAIRAGGMLVTIAGPIEARPVYGRTVDFVVEPDRAQLSEIVRGHVTDECGQTLATWVPSTMPLPPSTRPSGSTGRRSFALVREPRGRPALKESENTLVRRPISPLTGLTMPTLFSNLS